MNPEIFSMAMVQENAFSNMRTLATEYLEQQITAERFAKRCIDILQATDQATRKLADKMEKA